MRRVFFTIIYTAVLAGCVSHKPDPSLVGHYEAPTGEAIDLQLDGKIVYFFHDQVDFIGMINIERRNPIVVHVVGPDTAPLVGTKIIFSPNHNEIEVQWPNLTRGAHSSQRPTRYYAK